MVVCSLTQPSTAFYSPSTASPTGSYNLLQPFYSLLQPSTTFYSTNLTPPLLPSSFFLPDAANSELGQMHFITNVGLYVSFFLPDAANSELGQMHGLLPDCSVIGSNSFWGMGCFSTMVDTQDGYLHVRMSRFPELLFVGNRAILGPGSYPTGKQPITTY